MKDLEIGLLADFYGGLLNQKTKDILDLFYNQDMSLGEISKQLGITRQGVRDYLNRAKKSLLKYEDKLKLASKFYELKDELTQYKQKISSSDTIDKKDLLAFLDSILDKI
ncbi:MAG TPA: sigma factor-like helix-turn-helix DNA-binding protein [Clostridia bacterium]